MLENEKVTIAKFLQKKSLQVGEQSGSTSQESFLLNIWAKPGAKVDRVDISEQGELILFFREKPIDGKANKAIIKILSTKFGITQGSIELKSGQKSKKKRFSLCFEFTKNKTVSYYIEKLTESLGLQID